MLVRRRTVMLVVAAVALALLPIATAPASDEVAGVEAQFEDRTINLAAGWEGATACLIWTEATPQPECFATEAEMDARIAELEGAAGVATGKLGTALEGTMGLQCSSWLRLYDYTNYGGATLYLRDRLMWINLSTVGFNQRASSFKIGACSAYFADYSNGGGAWYPTSRTQAYDLAAWMISGWSNDVSSVYIT